MSAWDRIEQQEMEEVRRSQDQSLSAGEAIESPTSVPSNTSQDSTAVPPSAGSRAPDEQLPLSRQEVMSMINMARMSAQPAQQPDAGSLTPFEKEMLALLEQIVTQNEAFRSEVRSELKALSETVHANGRVRLDPDKLAVSIARALAPRLIDKLGAQFAASEKRMVEALSALEHRVVAVGNKMVAKMEEVFQKATKWFEKLEKIAARLKSALTWAGIGRVCAASLPVSLVFLGVAMLVGLGARLFGIAEIADWAWASFVAAEAWWLKLIILLSTVASGVGVCWVAHRLGKKLSEVYRGW